MQVDNLLRFSRNQSLVGANGTYKCDRTVQFQAPQALPPWGNQLGTHDMGMGTPVNVLVKVGTGIDSAGGTATVVARLVMADEETLTTNRVILQSSEAIPEATLVDGYEFRLGGTIPPGTTKKVIGVEYVTAGEAVTVGTVNATLPYDRDSAAFV